MYQDECHTDYTEECKQTYEEICKTEFLTDCKQEYQEICNTEYSKECKTEYTQVFYFDHGFTFNAPWLSMMGFSPLPGFFLLQECSSHPHCAMVDEEKCSTK